MSEIQLSKIAVTSDSDAALTQALERVNKNNTGGRVTKTDLASWFFLKGAADLNDQSIEEIRMAHFNQVIYLESLIKKLKQTNRDTLSLDEISSLQSMMKQQNTKRKNSSKSQISADKQQVDRPKEA